MAAAEVWRCVACGLPAPGRCERCTDPDVWGELRDLRRGEEPSDGNRQLFADDKRDAAKLAELGQAGLFPAGALPPRSTARGQSLLEL